MRSLLLGLLAFTGLKSHFAYADKLVLLDDTKESLQARANFLSSARIIKAQYFTVDNDDLSDKSLAMILERANQGAQVQIIVDSLNNHMLREKMAAIMMTHKMSVPSHIQIREYNTFNILNPLIYTHRMHDKGLIIDNSIMISGGRNIGESYFGHKNVDSKGNVLPIYEDSDILVMESSAIDTAVKYFDNLWNSQFVSDVHLYEFSKNSLDKSLCFKQHNISDCEWKIDQRVKIVEKEERNLLSQAQNIKNGLYEVKPQQNALAYWSTKAFDVSEVEFFYDDPVGQKRDLKKPKHNIADSLYEKIRSAKQQVTIITPYFIPTAEHLKLFAELKNKKIKVHVITNGKRSNDVTPAHVGYMMERDKALDLDVDILEYNGPDTLHAKMVIIDTNQMFVGSFNWDPRSQNLNREVGIFAKIPEYSIGILTQDVETKVKRILSRSTRLGAKKMLNQDIGDLEKKDVDKLVNQIREMNGSTLFWRLIYPLIKDQL